jgi:prepilin-type N-terminal cleavage/methylation domain-containing protein
MKNKKGQTLIELALVIALISVILLGITEFARAWFTKNSLKNAVRQGARVAVVTPVANFPTDCNSNSDPSGWAPCTDTNVIIKAVCSQPGIPPTTRVCVDQIDNNGITGFQSGDTVIVAANYNNPTFFVIGGTYFELFGIKIWPWERSLNITVDASMRYE